MQILDTLYSRTLRRKAYQLTDHVGNVRATVSDIVLPMSSVYRPDVLTLADYYPFGMQMDERQHVYGGAHPYGYNGQKKEENLDANGNHYTARFWEYDSRVALRWNRDPKPNASVSEYAVFNDNPVLNSDVYGDTAKGSDVTSGIRLRDEIRSSFNSNNAATLRGLFELGTDGMTMNSIAEDDFVDAIRDLSKEQQQLAYAYYVVINSRHMHTVEMISLTDVSVELNRTGASIDSAYGGGVNMHGKGSVASHSIIIMNSAGKPQSYKYGQLQKMDTPTRGEILQIPILMTLKLSQPAADKK